MSEPSANILIGRVSGLYGVKGWVKIHSYTRPLENIFSYNPWLLSGKGKTRVLRVLDGKIHGKGLLARFEGLDDRDAVIPLLNSNIEIERSQLPDASPGEYYWSDLIGLQVHNRADETLGRVTGLLETGSSDVLQVLGESGVRYLIPFVQGVYIDELDLQAGSMRVDWDREDSV